MKKSKVHYVIKLSKNLVIVMPKSQLVNIEEQVINSVSFTNLKKEKKATEKDIRQDLSGLKNVKMASSE